MSAAALGLVARGILAATFAVAAVAKLRDVAATRAALRASGLPASLDRTLPLVEAFTAFGLLMERRTVWAAWVAVGLLVVFTGFVVLQVRRSNTAPCPCFGMGPNAAPTGMRTLARNLALLAVAVVGTTPASSSHWVTWATAAIVTVALVGWARFSSAPAMPNP